MAYWEKKAKIDRVPDATVGNVAVFDKLGNVVDSGVNISDVGSGGGSGSGSDPDPDPNPSNYIPKCLGYITYTLDEDGGIGVLLPAAKLGDYFIVKYPDGLLETIDYSSENPYEELYNAPFYINGANPMQLFEGSNIRWLSPDNPYIRPGALLLCINDTEASTIDTYLEITANWRFADYVPYLQGLN